MIGRGKRVAGILELLAVLGADASRVEPPAGLADGWDLADALAEGWGKAEAACWIRAHMRSAAYAA